MDIQALILGHPAITAGLAYSALEVAVGQAKWLTPNSVPVLIGMVVYKVLGKLLVKAGALPGDTDTGTIIAKPAAATGLGAAAEAMGEHAGA